MARIKNLKKSGGGPLNKDLKVGWIVWGRGETEGTPFATLAKKVGWWPCGHPKAESDNFDEENEWAIALVCSTKELEAAGKALPTIAGWAEIAQSNKDTDPGYSAEEEEEEEETEEEDEEETEEEDEEETEEEDDDSDDDDEDDDDSDSDDSDDDDDDDDEDDDDD